MATQQQKISDLEKQVSATQAELRFHDTLMARTENMISDIAELTSELKSKAAVQDQRMQTMLEQLKHNHEDIEDLRRQNIKQDTIVANKLYKMAEQADKRFDSLEERVSSLEQYKWFIIGAVTIISFVIQMAGEIFNH